MSSKNSNGVTYGKGRTRNYATIVYPESAPDNWQELLSELQIPLFISPLHDQDLNPTGEPKKPHHHVMIMFDTVKTKEQAELVCKSFGGVGCIQVNSVRGTARYFCHMDNPEKHQYKLDDVKAYGGADYYQVIGTASDKIKMIKEMQEFIRENDVFYFCDLMDYASLNRSDWYDCLCNSGSYVIEKYIKSYTFKIQIESQVQEQVEDNDA